MPENIHCDYCDNEIKKDYRILLDGTRLHKECFSFIENPGKIFQSKIDVLSEEIDEIRYEMRSELYSRNLFQKLFNVETEKYIELKNRYKQLLKDHKNLLERASKYESEKRIEFNRYYDYWPERPPDWNSRSWVLRDEIQECEKCGRSETKKRRLHVHHIIPISDGGNHLESNLKVLCNYCHEKEHKHVFGLKPRKGNSSLKKKLFKIEKAIQNNRSLTFKYGTGQRPLNAITVKPLNITYTNGAAVRCLDQESGTKKVYALKRMKFPESDKKKSFSKTHQILKKAIQEDLLVHCIYTNSDGGKSERTLRPMNYAKFNDTQVIECYDYLREARRSFNPGRMENVKIVDEPGKQRRL